MSDRAPPLACDRSSSGELALWTVYNRPADFPDKIVARQFYVQVEGAFPTGKLITTETLCEMRVKLCRRGLFRLERAENDDPKVVETWI
jgi:hypothetical protein